MKNKFLIVTGLMFVTFSYSQEKGTGVILKVEPNGVVVYKPIDVEYTLGIKSESVQEQPEQQKESNHRTARTIDDFSVEELESMLYHADLKMEKISEEEGSGEALEYYTEQKKLIEEKLKVKKGK